MGMLGWGFGKGGRTAEEVAKDGFLDAELVGVGAVGKALEGFDVAVEAKHVLGSRADVVAPFPGCREICQLFGEVGRVVVEIPVLFSGDSMG